MIVIGVDPGQTGSMAILYPEETVVHDLPVIDKQLDANEFFSMLPMSTAGNPVVAYIERQQAMHKQGVTSTFNAGVLYGEILAVLKIGTGRVVKVQPKLWQKAFGILGKEKEKSRRIAMELFPLAELHLKKHHNRADALLIAEWGRRQKGLV